MLTVSIIGAACPQSLIPLHPPLCLSSFGELMERLKAVFAYPAKTGKYSTRGWRKKERRGDFKQLNRSYSD